MDLGGVRAGGAWSSRVVSPTASPTRFTDGVEFYDETRQMVYGRNHVHVNLDGQNLRGYLALFQKAGCGPLLSWVPFSVMRGIRRNNPDVDKEILVQLHNVSSFVVRVFPRLPKAENAIMEVIIYGVDGNSYPGFRFPDSGAEAFVAALRGAYEIVKVGERTSQKGLSDTTYNLVKPIKSPPTTPHKSNPSTPKTESSTPRSHEDRGGILARLFGPRSPSPWLEVHSLEEQVEQKIKSQRLKLMRQMLVAWRLYTYRQIKGRHDVAELVTRSVSTSRFPWVHLRPTGETNLLDRNLQGGLTEAFWNVLVDPEQDETIKDPDAFLKAIMYGAVSSQRNLAWRCLLQHYGLHQGKLARQERDQEVEHTYHALNREYKLAALSKVDTHLEMTKFIEHCDVIDQDVSRSDFHEDETGEYGDKLRSILRTFVWHNPKPGYVQGMLDLLEPILYVVHNEACAHFCFAHLLERAGPKFDRNSEFGIEVYLSKLRTLIAYEEPALSEHLRSLDADHLFFAYRWFLLDFKREFSKEDVLVIWETIWACEILHSEFFTVFIAFVVMQGYKDDLLRCRNSAEILRLFNCQMITLDAHEVAKQSVQVMMRLKSSLLAKGMILDQA